MTKEGYIRKSAGVRRDLEPSYSAVRVRIYLRPKLIGAVGGQESTQISGDLYALTFLHASVADRMVTTEINAYDQETCRKSETPTKFQRVAEPQTDFREACGVETIDSCMIAGKERTKIGYEN